MRRKLLRRLSASLALFLLCVMSWAQTRTVTGTVRDTQGAPIIGAAVVIQGSTTGTVTDFDGNFSISGLFHRLDNSSEGTRGDRLDDVEFRLQFIRSFIFGELI